MNTRRIPASDASGILDSIMKPLQFASVAADATKLTESSIQIRRLMVPDTAGRFLLLMSVNRTIANIATACCDNALHVYAQLITRRMLMKLLAGAVFLMSAEQAYAHAHLVVFPNHETASQVLLPASAALLIVGSLLVIWGLFDETRRRN